MRPTLQNGGCRTGVQAKRPKSDPDSICPGAGTFEGWVACTPGARRRKGRAFPDTKLQRFWHGPCYVLHHKQGGCHDIGNDASRAHRKAARHQARKWLELETYLRRDRRHVASAHYGRHSWPNETNQAAGGQGCRIVRLEQDRAGAAQRGSASRFADAADRSVDLSLL